MPERIDFWGIPQPWGPILVYSIVSLAAIVFLVGFYRQASLWWKVGRPEKRWDHPLQRLWNVVKVSIVQLRILRQQYPGIMHLTLAWAYFVFFLGTAFATINGHFFKFLEGSPYLIYKFVLDIFTIIFIVGAAMAAFRRFVKKPDRLTLSPRFTWSLIFIITIVINGLLVESFRLAIQKPDWALWSPVGWAVAQLWIVTGIPEAVLHGLHVTFYFIHFLSVSALFVILPTSSLVHILTGPLNAFFADLDRPTGRLPALPQNKQSEPIYASTLGGLTWKQLLDADTCTECGRCQDACPSYKAGGAISPKQLIVNVRDALHRDGWAIAGGNPAPLLVGFSDGQASDSPPPAPAQGRGNAFFAFFRPALHPRPKPAGTGDEKTDNSAPTPLMAGDGGWVKDASLPQKVVDYGISEEMVWACTTCGACDQECPVQIDHTNLAVDFRRYLVSEGKVETRLQDVLANLSRYGNSFGQSERARPKWAQSLPVKVRDARKEAVEYLWFVGDYASYNPQVTDVTRQTAEIFQKAGLDFGILYEGERNSGNDVRRVGEEGLYEFLVEKNAAALGKCTFQKMVTCDPHTYNTLRNEYPADVMGGRPVLHSSELFRELAASGKIQLSKKLGYRVTYHDPCYLGRYNQIYAAPRGLIEATGCILVEMPRHGAQALCCNAGGGRIWMDEGALKERPSESRVREAAALAGVEMLVVACPKDLVMFRDAVKTTGLEGKLVVKELAELVAESMS